jgi:lysophospholipase L1-like esterase
MKRAAFFIVLLTAISLKAQVTLNPCISNTDFTIVVLGSSTAAGTGPSHPDSTWVNKYRKTLQNINPNNQVINLAVGGYTTYRIMPDSFATPPNRPAVNFQHNIDEALSYSPDAIIVNLPSNDRQWPMQEQLSNFDTLYNYSLSHGVPFYICTTQPIASIGSASYQKAVADSILNTFAQHAIDIFTPLADTNNTVDTSYAADAVHLNDKGHVIIHAQVVNTDILNTIYTVPSGIDIAMKSIFNSSPNCTDSNAQVGVVYANLGDTILSGVPIVLDVNGISYNANNTNVLPSCFEDTAYFSVNLSKDTTYVLTAFVTLSSDSNSTNDSIVQAYELIKTPEILPVADTNCFGDTVSFATQLVEGDTILYYRSANDTIPLSSVSPFSLNSDTALFAQGVTGELTYKNGIETQETGNINFKGNMFDLVPSKDIHLRTIEIKPNQSGTIPVNIFTISGSYKGNEQNAIVWTLYKQDTLQTIAAQEWAALDMNLNMLANDTIGFYIQMENSGHTLNYRSVSQPETHSTGELEYISGAGIAGNFGNIYYPRVITSKFNYTYGLNLLGECHTPRIQLTHSISKETVSITQNAQFTLEGDTLFATGNHPNYIWVNTFSGDTISTTHSAFVDSMQLAPNSTTAHIICYAQDKWGCLQIDSTVVNLEGYLSLMTNDLIKIKMYPNPVSSELFIENPQNIALEISIYNSMGQLVISEKANQEASQIDCSQLRNGQYIVHITSEHFNQTQKIIVMKSN